MTCDACYADIMTYGSQIRWKFFVISVKCTRRAVPPRQRLSGWDCMLFHGHLFPSKSRLCAGIHYHPLHARKDICMILLSSLTLDRLPPGCSSNPICKSGNPCKDEILQKYFRRQWDQLSVIIDMYNNRPCIGPHLSRRCQHVRISH